MIFFFLLYKNIPHPVYPVCSTTTTTNWEHPVFHAFIPVNNIKIIEKFKLLNSLLGWMLDAGGRMPDAGG
jgi:hypothetical protein